jgi:hypothetical protein
MRTHKYFVPLYKFCHPGDLAPTICSPLDSGIAKHYPSVPLSPAVNPQPTLSLLVILVLLYEYSILKVADFKIACMIQLG